MKMNGFADVSVMEMEEVNGGFWPAVAVGIVASVAVDYVVKKVTGQSLTTWAEKAIDSAVKWTGEKTANGYFGG